jgi:hypothetical protein
MVRGDKVFSLVYKSFRAIAMGYFFVVKKVAVNAIPEG